MRLGCVALQRYASARILVDHGAFMHARAVDERVTGMQDHAGAFGKAGEDFGVLTSLVPQLDERPPRAAAIEHVGGPSIAVAEQRAGGNLQNTRRFPDDHTDLDAVAVAQRSSYR